jgi:DNA-directed RNA polymerase specialized sigma24 family protein
MAMTISIDDRQLVESYQAGDTDAFAELVGAHGPSLLGHAIRKLGDRAAAEDAVQETFVRAYRALPRFDGDYRLGPWLHRILANVCADEGNRRTARSREVRPLRRRSLRRRDWPPASRTSSVSTSTTPSWPPCSSRCRRPTERC